MADHVKQLRAFGNACGDLERRGLNAAADHIEFLEALIDECVALMDQHKVPVRERLRASGRAAKTVNERGPSA